MCVCVLMTAMYSQMIDVFTVKIIKTNLIISEIPFMASQITFKYSTLQVLR